MFSLLNKKLQKGILNVVDASLNAVSRGCLLSGGRGDAVESPWAAYKFFRIPKISFFIVSTLVKILLQIGTVLVTQIHVRGLLGI